MYDGCSVKTQNEWLMNSYIVHRRPYSFSKYNLKGEANKISMIKLMIELFVQLVTIILVHYKFALFNLNFYKQKTVTVWRNEWPSSLKVQIWRSRVQASPIALFP